MNNTDFQTLALWRLSDAQALLAAHVNDAGAYYLAGYAVECALKACIANLTKAGDFPPQEIKDYYSHKLATLLKTARLEAARNVEAKANPAFSDYWDMVVNWNEQTRYSVTLTRKQAEDIIEAVEDPTNGVLRWLQQHW